MLFKTSPLKSNAIDVSGIPIEIIRKNVKRWRLVVSGAYVRVTVPQRAADEMVRRMVTPKLDWIKSKQAKLAAHPAPPPHTYSDGETHLLWGEHYRLCVVPHQGRAQVKIHPPDGVHLFIADNATVAIREAVLHRWYRRQIMHEAPKLIAKWEVLIGVQTTALTYKKMRSQWGSCNITDRRICLNIDLAKRPLACLEFVVVHELVHLLERYHNARFYSLMDKFHPPWKIASDALDKQSPI